MRQHGTRLNLVGSPADTEAEVALDPPRIVIIGSGVVGTATGTGFAAHGFDVTFCDVSLDRIALLRRGGFHAIDAVELTDTVADAYLLSVPTPTAAGRVDLSYLEMAVRTLGTTLAEHPGKPLVVVRSTVPPGTTQRRVIPWLQEVSGKRAGTDFLVGMNPEFLRAATAAEDFAHPRVVVLGSLDAGSDAALRNLYRPWAAVPTISTDLVTAEATKYVANLFNAAKISFFNEMHTALDFVGADPAAAFRAVCLGAEGMWNPSYGTRGRAPYGGVCLPKDTVGFLGFATENEFAELLPMLLATIAVNDRLRAEGQPELPATQIAAPRDELSLTADEL
jgi:UDPglucose 6-dehydrogenase